MHRRVCRTEHILRRAYQTPRLAVCIYAFNAGMRGRFDCRIVCGFYINIYFSCARVRVCVCPGSLFVQSPTRAFRPISVPYPSMRPCSRAGAPNAPASVCACGFVAVAAAGFPACIWPRCAADAMSVGAAQGYHLLIANAPTTIMNA